MRFPGCECDPRDATANARGQVCTCDRVSCDAMRTNRAVIVGGFVLAACAQSVSVPGAPTGDASADSSLDAADGARNEDVYVPADDLDSFARVSAEAVCAGMFRCCAEVDRAVYVRAFLSDDRVHHLRDRRMFTDAATCRVVMEEVFRTATFADWIDAARRGMVRYDPSGSVACRRALAVAACGRDLVDALYLPGCYSPYSDLSESRRMFVRSAGEGEPCRAIQDMALRWSDQGSCDPERAFCCVPSATGTAHCLSPYELIGTSAPDGRCRAASDVGGPCSGAVTRDVDYRACRGTLWCARMSLRCMESDITTPRAAGEPCYDPEEGVRIGRCPDGHACDGFRSSGSPTNTCLPQVREGAPCESSSLCETFACVDGFCRAPAPTCTGR